MGNEADLRDKSFDSRLAQIWEAAWRLWWLLACSAVARGGRSRGRREGAAAEVAPLTSTARRQSPPPPPTPACAPTAPRPLHPSLGADLVREPANRARQRQIDAGGASVRQCRMGSSGSTASDGSGRGHLHPCFLPPTTLSCHVAPPRHCPSAQLPARFHILPLHLEAADSRRDADITVAARPMDEKCATAFGLIKSNKEGRIIKFAEKPKGDQLKAMVHMLHVSFLSNLRYTFLDNHWVQLKRYSLKCLHTIHLTDQFKLS